MINLMDEELKNELHLIQDLMLLSLEMQLYDYSSESPEVGSFLNERFRNLKEDIIRFRRERREL